MAALSLAETVQWHRSNVEEDEVVGFDEYADELTNLLVRGSTSCPVVSIVMVGCGKTTLARKVFKDTRVNVTISQQDDFGFDCLSWAFATKEFNAKEFSVGLLRSLKTIPKDELKRIKNDMDDKESDDDAAKTREIAMLKTFGIF